MVAAELSRTPNRRCGARRGGARWLGSSLHAYWGVWASTLAGLLVVWIAGEPMRALTRQVLGLELHPTRAPSDQLGQIVALAAHNAPIAAWPLLLGLVGADRHRWTKRLADCLVATCVLVNAVPVGAALATYGNALIAYVPQLPVEWAGIALGAGAWLVQRRGAISARERLLCFCAISALLLYAGALETIAVPRSEPSPGPAARVNVALAISNMLDSCSRQIGAVQVILHQDTHFAGFAGSKDCGQRPGIGWR